MVGKKDKKRTVYRDSKTGHFISKKQAERKSPATWEKERIKVPKQTTAKRKAARKGPGTGPRKK